MQTVTRKGLSVLLTLFLCSVVPALAQTFSIKPSGNITLCKGDSVTLEATSGFVRYLWSNRSTARTIRVGSTGTYYCAAYDKNGKLYADSVNVHVLTPQQPKLWFKPSNQTICDGDSLIVEVANTFKAYKWSTGSTGNRVVLYPKSSGYVTLLTIDSNGCKYETHVQYTVKNCSGNNSCDSLIEPWPDAVICHDHDSVILEGKSGYSQYYWNDGDRDRVKVVKKAGTYILKAIDAKGNYCYDTIEIKASQTRLTITAKPNPPEICKGDSVVLKASEGFKSYGWTTKQTSREIVVKPTTTTGYLVEAIDSLGCERKEDIKVVVKSCDDCDDLIGIGHKKVLCGDHDSIILEGKSGFASYQWNNGSKDRILVVKSKGWYVLTAKTQWGKVCVDSIYIDKGGKTLNLYSNPKHPVVCPGDKVVVEATNGFKSYWWNTGHRTDRVELYLKETKEVVVEAVDSFGCESRAVLKIVVKDTCNKKCPEIIEFWPKKVLCGDHDSISLEAKTGYKDYKWSTGTSGRHIWVKRSGWYWLDFVDDHGNKCRDSIYIGKGSSKKLEITLYPKGPYCPGDTVLAGATIGFKSYWWSKGSSTYPITGFVITKKEKLVVEAVDSNGCGARAEVVLELDTCNSSVHEILKRSIRLHPNPTENRTTLTSDLAFEKLRVVDINGRVIQTITPESTTVSIDLTGVKPGLYFIAVEKDGIQIFTRLVKQ